MSTQSKLAKPPKSGRASKPKATPMAGRARSDVDGSTYSGRLAIRVRELREAKGLSVDDLAKKIKASAAAVYTWEQGTRDIPLDKCPLLAKALGCKTPDELFPPLK